MNRIDLRYVADLARIEARYVRRLAAIELRSLTRHWSGVRRPATWLLERAHVQGWWLGAFAAAGLLAVTHTAPQALAVLGPVLLWAALPFVLVDLTARGYHRLWEHGRLAAGVECPVCGHDGRRDDDEEFEPGPDDPEDHVLTPADLDWLAAQSVAAR